MTHYMTIKELIKKLQQYPGDMEVFKISDHPEVFFNSGSVFGSYVQPVAMISTKHVKNMRIAVRPCEETDRKSVV